MRAAYEAARRPRPPGRHPTGRTLVRPKGQKPGRGGRRWRWSIPPGRCGSSDKMTPAVDRRGRRHTEEGAMWRTLAGAVAGLLVLFVGSLAFNAASGQSRWPGPLDLVRVHPWVVLLVLIPISFIGLWQA